MQMHLIFNNLHFVSVDYNRQCFAQVVARSLNIYCEFVLFLVYVWVIRIFDTRK